eukprot:scaffold3691_cov394-Prasinococcus_capsulatus_cf.AAC.17
MSLAPRAVPRCSVPQRAATAGGGGGGAAAAEGPSPRGEGVRAIARGRWPRARAGGSGGARARVAPAARRPSFQRRALLFPTVASYTAPPGASVALAGPSLDAQHRKPPGGTRRLGNSADWLAARPTDLDRGRCYNPASRSAPRIARVSHVSASPGKTTLRLAAASGVTPSSSTPGGRTLPPALVRRSAGRAPYI